MEWKRNDLKRKDVEQRDEKEVYRKTEKRIGVAEIGFEMTCIRYEEKRVELERKCTVVKVI